MSCDRLSLLSIKRGVTKVCRLCNKNQNPREPAWVLMLWLSSKCGIRQQASGQYLHRLFGFQ